MSNEMSAKINEVESANDIEVDVNDYWNRSQQVLDEMIIMKEKLDGLVEITVVPFIINVVSQILLLIIGEKPNQPSTASYTDKMNKWSKLLEMDRKTFNILVDTRGNKHSLVIITTTAIGCFVFSCFNQQHIEHLFHLPQHF